MSMSVGATQNYKSNSRFNVIPPVGGRNKGAIAFSGEEKVLDDSAMKTKMGLTIAAGTSGIAGLATQLLSKKFNIPSWVTLGLYGLGSIIAVTSFFIGNEKKS